MKTVVITGSTRGIGYGMAHEFLQRGHQVMISGRSAESSEKAALALAIKHDAARIGHCACEVADYRQVQGLWDAAVQRFGRVDVWINNAGVTTYEEHFEKLSPDDIRTIVETNSIGMMYGSHVALRGMQMQSGGQIYNMEGLGSDGMIRASTLVYGSTKYGLRYFTKGLIQQVKETPVQVGYLSPGIVATDMMAQSSSAQDLKNNRILNALGDRVETVTPWLVENMLQNTQNGAAFRWLTTRKIYERFFRAFVLREKREVF
jgi:NAD(P)-dependent dehydrogenase (short-subunit alcohol dehydrogenase family)